MRGLTMDKSAVERHRNYLVQKLFGLEEKEHYCADFQDQPPQKPGRICQSH